jgi:hypothetical protein
MPARQQHRNKHPGSARTPHADSGSTPGTGKATQKATRQEHTAPETVRDPSQPKQTPGMSDPNVKMVPTET